MENMSTGKSALGMDGNITALLGYIIGIVALILVFIEKDNKFVRFHAFQSLLWFAMMFVLIFAVAIIGMILAMIGGSVSEIVGMAIGGITLLLYLGCFLAMFGGLIYGAIQSFGGKMTKLPIVGNFAEKFSK